MSAEGRADLDRTSDAVGPAGPDLGAVERCVLDAVVVAADRADELVCRGRERLGDRLAVRLEQGLDRVSSLDVAGARDVARSLIDGTADTEVEWTLNVVLQITEPHGLTAEALLQLHRSTGLGRRRSAPLPTERWRRLQRADRLTDEQTACLQRLTRRSRSLDARMADAYEQLLDDCFVLASVPRPPEPPALAAVFDRLDAEVVVLDDRLRAVVEGEWLVDRSVERTRRAPRIVVLCGPPSVGKRRFVRATAAALARSFHHVRCASLPDPRVGLLGEWSPPDDASRGEFVEAGLAAAGRRAVLFLEGIDEVGDTAAGTLAATLIDLADRPDRMLRDRYLPDGFGLDLGSFLVVVSARSLAGVPAGLRDHAEVIELGPPSPQDRKLITERFILPSLCRPHGVEPTAIVTPDLVGDLVDRHDARAGMRELERDLARVVATWVSSDDAAPIDRHGLDAVLGPVRRPAGTNAPGSYPVPLIDDSSGFPTALDATAIRGWSGTLVPDAVHPRTAALIRDAVETARDLSPLGISLPAGIRVTIGLQSTDGGWHAPWLSVAAALASCSLAAGRPLDASVGVLGVLSPRGAVEPIDLPEPIIRNLIRAMEWDRVVVPGHLVDRRDDGDPIEVIGPHEVWDLPALLRLHGLDGSESCVPGMYL